MDKARQFITVPFPKTRAGMSTALEAIEYFRLELDEEDAPDTLKKLVDGRIRLYKLYLRTWPA